MFRGVLRRITTIGVTGVCVYLCGWLAYSIVYQWASQHGQTGGGAAFVGLVLVTPVLTGLLLLIALGAYAAWAFWPSKN